MKINYLNGGGYNAWFSRLYLKVSLSLIILFSTFGFSFAQMMNARVLGYVPIGDLRYYMLQDENLGNYFKSEVTELDNLQYGDLVQINSEQDINGYQKVFDLSETYLFKAVQQNANGSSTDPDYVDPSVLYRLPNVYRGMLVFENKEQFDELYSVIDDFLETKKATTGKDYALSLIQKTLNNYISFREFFEQKYPGEEINEEGYTETEIEKIEKEDFIHDEIYKFLLNKFRMVIIANEVYYYHDFYTSIKYNLDELDRLKYENERISLLEDINLLNDGIYLPYDKDVDVLSDFVFIPKDLEVVTKPGPVEKSYLRASHAITTFPNFCDIHKIKFRVNTFFGTTTINDPNNQESLYQLTGVNNAFIFINWGDGTSQTVYNYQNEDIEHFYGLPMTYDISYTLVFTLNGVSYDFKDGYPANLYPNQNPIKWTIPNGVCNYLNDHESQWKQNGDWKMYASSWVSSNWLANRVGALTHSWKKNSKGKWHRKIANIEAEINAKMRNDNCDVAENISKQDIENQERTEVNKWKFFKKYKSIISYDIYSYHVLQKDGVTIVLTIIIFGC